MKSEYVDPFIASIKTVFATMLNCRLTRGEPSAKESFQPHHDISGVIGLSGNATGAVVLSLGRDAALAITEALLHERPADINTDVVDAVGELTNMIAGGAKAQFEQFSLSSSLPSIITGKTHCVKFPSNVEPISIPFHCQWGEVVLEVGLVEQPAEVLAAT